MMAYNPRLRYEGFYAIFDFKEVEGFEKGGDTH